MGLVSLLLKDPIMFIILAVPLLYSIILHEVAHGYVAYLFGDNTAKYSGRLSLNPISHIDPIGAIALFIVGFGWAKPVPVDYRNFRNIRLGLICVSLAGCLTNILIAIISLFALQFLNLGSSVSTILLVIAKINIILGAFNLIPIPPLDGSKILMGFLPYEWQLTISRIEPYGFFILIFLIFTGYLNPIIIFAQNIILWFIGLLIGLVHK